MRVLFSAVFMAAGLLCVCGQLAAQEVKFTLNQLFQDNAVLQRQVKHPVWGTAPAGSKVLVNFNGNKAETQADQSGKWTAELTPMEAGGPFDMTVENNGRTIVSKNLLVGEVWLVSGQSNADFPLKRFSPCVDWLKDADYPNIRFLKQTWQPPHMRKDDKWSVCSGATAENFSATGFFFAKALQKKLNVPVGIVVSASDGTVIARWISVEALSKIADARKNLLDPFKKAQDDYQAKKKAYDEELSKRKALSKEEEAALPKLNPVFPPPQLFSTSFDQTILPLIPFPFRGCVWYQGESNAMFAQGYVYRFYLTEMIRDWRAKWGRQSMPFLVVEIPRYTQTHVWADLRDSQKYVAETVTGVHLVTILELGELKDIHPPRKDELGARLALSARKNIYGEKDLLASGPVYKSMKINGDSIILEFDNIGGGLISSDGQPLREFTVAGEDKKFYPSTANIVGNTVVVSSPLVKQPKAVRYAWRDAVDVNFFNAEKLSAGQFRTDDWKIPTQRD